MPPLIDPTRDGLARALAQAGSRQAKSEAERALTAMRGAPQGRLPYPPKARRLTVTWWSDHHGRRHVTAEPVTPPEHPWQEEPAWPPLGRIYPGVLFRIDRPGRPLRWVVLCRCGVCGPPESVGWMGDRCGPCHDRGVDGSPVDEEYPAVAPLDFPRPVHGLAWRAGGRSLYFERPGLTLARLDLVAGGWALSEDWAGVRGFAGYGLVPSPTDHDLVADHDPEQGVVRLFTHQGRLRQSLPVGQAGGAGLVNFSGDGATLAAAVDDAGWRVFRAAGDGFRETLRHDGFAGEVVVSKDGRLLALQGREENEIRIVEAESGRTRQAFVTGAGTRLGRWLTDSYVLMNASARGGHPEVWDVSAPARVATLHTQLHGPATPCGRFLLWKRGGRNDPALCLGEFRTGEIIATFASDPSAGVTAAVFSHDGGWLALADTGPNLRVVRWGPLLDAILAGG